MPKKKPQPKKENNADMAQAEANGRIQAFNNEVIALAKKYQVRLDISQRIVVVDNKATK